MQNIGVYSNFLFTERTIIYPVIEILWKVTLSIKEYSKSGSMAITSILSSICTGRFKLAKLKNTCVNFHFHKRVCFV